MFTEVEPLLIGSVGIGGYISCMVYTTTWIVYRNRTCIRFLGLAKQ